MKKAVKTIVIGITLIIGLLILTGCGNKLVVSKEIEDMGQKYVETIEYSFKKDKISHVKITMDFENTEQAEAIITLFKARLNNVKRNDNKIIMEFDAKEYAEYESEEIANMSRDELEKLYKDAKYTIK